MVVARYPAPSCGKLRLFSRLSVAVGDGAVVIARVRARRSLSYLFRKLLRCEVMAVKVVASEWLWSWVTCRAQDAVGGGSAEGGDRPGGPAGGACLPGLVGLPAQSGSQATLFQLTGSRSVSFGVPTGHFSPPSPSLYTGFGGGNDRGFHILHWCRKAFLRVSSHHKQHKPHVLECITHTVTRHLTALFY